MARRRQERFPYIPVNQEKFRGSTPIFFRSKWERDYAMQYLDHSSNVISWSYEAHYIRYYDPVMKKLRVYIPDFNIKYANGDDFLIEFKPKKQTIPPKASKRKKKKTIIREEQTWARNKAKWEAAQKYCERTRKEFKIVTEESLGYYKARKVKKKLGRKK